LTGSAVNPNRKGTEEAMVEAQTARRAIGEVMESLVASWNRHDASQFAALFAEDADFTNVFGMAVHGRWNI
jgi:uncharacterized protein (TIGR02246 family)